jgi:hypothetical protein
MNCAVCSDRHRFGRALVLTFQTRCQSIYPLPLAVPEEHRGRRTFNWHRANLCHRVRWKVATSRKKTKEEPVLMEGDFPVAVFGPFTTMAEWFRSHEYPSRGKRQTMCWSAPISSSRCDARIWIKGSMLFMN